MLEKQALKKFINSYGKDEMLHWGYKDGRHYLSNGYVVISGTEAVFDTEIVGLLYKYFGIIPESSDTVYRNKTEYDSKNDVKVFTYYEGTVKVQGFADMLKVKDEYPALVFSKVYVAPKNSGEMALYIDADNLKCVCVNRMYHQLIDWDIFAGMIAGTGAGIIFTHFETGTTMLVLEIRAGKSQFLSIINHNYAFAGDTNA